MVPLFCLTACISGTPYVARKCVAVYSLATPVSAVSGIDVSAYSALLQNEALSILLHSRSQSKPGSHINRSLLAWTVCGFSITGVQFNSTGNLLRLRVPSYTHIGLAAKLRSRTVKHSVRRNYSQLRLNNVGIRHGIYVHTFAILWV